MGYIKHNAMIVTSWSEKDIELVRASAIKIFNNNLYCGSELITETICTRKNQYYTFFISPDGSKEGWIESEKGDLSRKELIKFVEDNELTHIDIFDIKYGGDDEFSSMESNNEIILG